MTAATASPLVPKLRFPEFDNNPGWNAMPLSAASDVNPSSGGLPESFVYIDLESVKDGVLVERKEITRDAAPSRAQRFLRRKDIIYQTVRPYQRNNLLFDLDDGYEYVASTGYAQIRAHDCPEFLYQLLHTDSFVNRVLAKCTGSNYPAINPSALADVGVALPTNPEQQKIADCLGSLDDLIAAEGRMLEALRQHKQGLMQQLFPRPGETVPRLRFPEFHRAGGWETRSLGSLADIQSGATPSRANPLFWGGSIPWVSAKDMKRLFLEDTEDHISAEALDNGARLAPVGTVLLLTRGMTLLKDVPICVARREMSFNQDVKGLLPKPDVDGLFLAFSLLGNRQRLRDMVDLAGHGTGKLNTDELEAFELAAPQSAEQNRIAAWLSALDGWTSAQARKIAILSQHKQGLLQQLFPAMGARMS